MNGNFLAGKLPKKENQQTFTNSRHKSLWNVPVLSNRSQIPQFSERFFHQIIFERKLNFVKSPGIIFQSRLKCDVYIKITVKGWLVTAVEAHIDL